MAKVKGSIPQLGELFADVWVDERHRREMEITSNPIEFGSPAGDHAFVKPQELGITFSVSNQPFEASESFTADDRIAEAREILYSLQDNSTFLTVKTITGGEYTNMLLAGIGWPTDKENPSTVNFSLDLKEVKVVTTQQTDYKALPPEKKTKKKTDPTSKKGKKPKSKLPSDKKGRKAAAGTSKKSRAEATATRESARDAAASARNESYTNPQKAKGAAASKQLDTIKKSDNRTQLKKIVDAI